jgi:hypothetical protein
LASLLARADEVIEQRLPCCDCSQPLMALFCRADRARQCPFMNEKRKTLARIEVFSL